MEGRRRKGRRGVAVNKLRADDLWLITLGPSAHTTLLSLPPPPPPSPLSLALLSRCAFLPPFPLNLTFLPPTTSTLPLSFPSLSLPPPPSLSPRPSTLSLDSSRPRSSSRFSRGGWRDGEGTGDGVYGGTTRLRLPRLRLPRLRSHVRMVRMERREGTRYGKGGRPLGHDAGMMERDERHVVDGSKVFIDGPSFMTLPSWPFMN
jgi:hypothetical protein